MPSQRSLVALIFCPASMLEDDSRQPPNGLVSLATVTRKLGFNVRVCDLSGMPAEALCSAVGEADVAGFATYTATYSVTLRLKRELKDRNPHLLTIAGGPHASALPEEVAKDFDVVCGA